MRRRLFLSFLVLLAVIVPPKTIHAQVEQGGITGRVFDEAGAVVPGATVTATQAGTGLVRDTVTNAAGLYNVPYLPVGVCAWGSRRRTAIPNDCYSFALSPYDVIFFQ